MNITKAPYGLDVYFNRTFRSTFPNDVRVIKMIVKYETDTRLHIKIVDPENSRWEPPLPLVPKVEKMTENPAYVFEIDEKQSGFKVIRKLDNFVM